MSLKIDTEILTQSRKQGGYEPIALKSIEKILDLMIPRIDMGILILAISSVL